MGTGLLGKCEICGAPIKCKTSTPIESTALCENDHKIVRTVEGNFLSRWRNEMRDAF